VTAESELGPCAWCGEPSVTHLIIVPGKKKRKLAVVCEEHAARFEAQGQMTTRREVELQLERDLNKSHWTPNWRRT
jgi:hypothetical protein